MSNYHYGSYVDSTDTESPPPIPNAFSLGAVVADAQNIGLRPPDTATLGADIAEIRARVLGARQPTAKLSADDHKVVYKELQSLHQIDLNEEKNLAHLEDPGLVAHMNSARQQLTEYQRTLARLPRRESLRTLHLDSVGSISQQLRKFDEYDMFHREQVEHAHRLVRIIENLARRKPIHGTSASLSHAAASDPTVIGALNFACEKAKEVAQSFQHAVNGVVDMKGELFTVRHQFETVGDGLLELIESAEEGRRRLQEYNEIITARLDALDKRKVVYEGACGDL